MKKLKPLKDRLTPAILNRLHKRKITNAEAATLLHVSETHLSRTVAAIQGKVPGITAPQREAAAKLTKVRKEVRCVLAKKVLKNRITLADAAVQAGCSERTMSRYVALYRPE